MFKKLDRIRGVLYPHPNEEGGNFGWKKANKGEFTDADAIAVQQRLVKESK